MGVIKTGNHYVTNITSTLAIFGAIVPRALQHKGLSGFYLMNTVDRLIN